MQETVVLTVVGKDRPGIVKQISAVVSEHGGNWHESRMALLAGQFAGLMRAQVPIGCYNDLCRALDALSRDGLQVTVVRDAAVEAPASEALQKLSLDVTGNDRAGILRDISTVLAQHGVNVEELDTEVSPAPMSSHTLFKASAKLNAAPDLDLDILQDALETLSHDLIIELGVQRRVGS